MRHGESFSNVLGIDSTDRDKYPLTKTGIAQVRASVLQLVGVDLDGILCSPILRTRQSAKIASDILGIEMEDDERLIETGLGVFDGNRFPNISLEEGKDLGVESWFSHIMRTKECINSRKGSYLIVSHEYPISALICSYLGRNDESSCIKEVSITYASMSGVICETSEVLFAGSSKLTSDNIRKFAESV